MTLILPDVAEQGLLTRITLQDLELHLYKNDVLTGLTPSQIAALDDSDFIEADFTGYSEKTLTGGSWTITAGEPSQAVYALQSFTSTADQTAQNIYGYYYTTTANSLRGFRQFEAPQSIEFNNEQIDITPKLHLSGNEDLMPTGSITEYGAAAAPPGWLLCDGSAVSRTTYADLFAVIDTTYGVGDGSTTFNVPDFRQKFALGVAASGTGSTLGGTGGSIDHTHLLASGYANLQTGTDFIRYDTVTTASQSYDSQLSPTAAKTTPSGSLTEGVTLGGSSASNNPPFLAVNYIIKT